MSFQSDPAVIEWRLHLQAPRERVYAMLNSDAGRASFWAESAREHAGAIDFVFPGNLTWRADILERVPSERFCVRYYGGSITTFVLHDDGAGGTDLHLTDVGVPAEDRSEVIAGWVSVLMALRAAVDFGVDLRGHHAEKHWGAGYVEN